MALGEGKILRHLRAPFRAGQFPARWLLKGRAPGTITAKAKPARLQLARSHGWRTASGSAK
ncbi:hypothetical protein BQ8482_130244 [Mesorhizobium delmotii]|uniref:Uncharacterized protein n=1 Tax=Mesorhizobium delmotii TaxID=1631247 RepID=A0A2P9AGT6_9HYPH|nr:hypothetical protein BQ8482_130244 [Mesorhizobium delmotii]